VEWNTLGVVSVEHDGRPAHKHDGLCLTVLLALDGAANTPDTAATRDDLQVADKNRYGWLTVTDTDILQRLDSLSVGPVTLRAN